jgi:hypothetical protein
MEMAVGKVIGEREKGDEESVMLLGQGAGVWSMVEGCVHSAGAGGDGLRRVRASARTVLVLGLVACSVLAGL